MSDHEEMVPLTEAENEVKVTTQRLALLHLAFAKTLVKEYGWERGKQLVMNAIKQYGEYVAERTKKGYQGLPKYGFWERREGKPPLCELGKIMVEYGEPELGSLYCLIDPAKTMAANPEEKLIHTECMIYGDDQCSFETVSTTKKDLEDFAHNKDWAHVDPVIAEYIKNKENRDN